MQSSKAQPLSALPSDILRIILAKIGLKDRLRLELLDRSHRDALRESEVWCDINLSAMQALDLTEEQLLKLLSRTGPSFMKKIGRRIPGMADTLRVLTYSQLASQESADEETSGEYLTSFVLARLPVAWADPVRTLFETTASWFSEQLERIPQVFKLLGSKLSQGFGDSGLLVEKLLLRLVAGPFKSGPALRKVAIFLDVSGARRLSPTFLAACIIALSAGFEVDFTMKGHYDPPFPLNPLAELVQSLSAGSSIHINLLVSPSGKGSEQSFNFDPWSQLESGQKVEEDHLQVANRVAALYFCGQAVSNGAYSRFVDHILLLVKLRQRIHASLGSRSPRSEACKISSRTVCFQNLVDVRQPMLDKLRKFLQKSPPKLGLIFQYRELYDLPVLYAFGRLCKLLGESDVGFVSFQLLPREPQRGLHNLPHGWGFSILDFQDLQRSTGLQSLDLAVPLSFPSHDYLDYFLEWEEHGAEIVIHLRPDLYPQDSEVSSQLARTFVSQLEKVCLPRWGFRVTIVHYPGGPRVSRLGAARAVESTGGGFGSFSPPFREEMPPNLWYDEVLRAGDCFVFACTLSS